MHKNKQIIEKKHYIETFQNTTRFKNITKENLYKRMRSEDLRLEHIENIYIHH